MVNETTISKLNEMRLTAMAESFRQQIKDTSFNELNIFENPGCLVSLYSRGRGFRFSPRNSSKSHKLFPVLLGIRTNYGTYLP